MKDRFYLELILIVFLLTFAGSVYYASFTRSSANQLSEPSVANSYVFVSPLRAKANGDWVRANVIVLDASGRGVKNQLVDLVSDDKHLRTITVQNRTDETGRAVFDITSNAKGNFKLEAKSNGTSLKKNVNVVFD